MTLLEPIAAEATLRAVELATSDSLTVYDACYLVGAVVIVLLILGYLGLR